MAKLKTATAGFNAGKKESVKYIQIDKIKIDPEIAGIFKISAKDLENLKESIRQHDFYEEEPLVIWKDHDILLDGRTRYTAAKEVGKTRVPYVEKEFASRDEAILYTIGRQVLRRNITSKEIVSAVGMFFKGRKEKNDGSGRMAEILAKMLGVSPATIYQAKYVVEHGTPEDIKKIKKGGASLKKMDAEIRDRYRPEKDFTASDSQSLPGNISFLKSAVILLIDAGQLPAGEMLVNHFLRKHEKTGFYNLLPKKVSNQLPRLPLLNTP